eukprot:TRINITY_DN55687_c0_g1_i1.p1 TRINITY_DN55687_c0_g1~~TRINITY_DN55687_c0_g1_i1.p1  ORF type:complete len:278 (-),score=50.78 TRINITY_DN55687_c0_g1_i1:3-836(-)
MGLHISSGGFGCGRESDEFEHFQDTGGQVRCLIIGLDYHYSPGNELTAITDGKNMERICELGDCHDVTVMYDTFQRTDPLFPTRPNVKRVLRELGERSADEDFVVIFYAGHGENLPDAPPMDEEDGFDEAFVLPGPRGEIAAEHFFVDDDFTLLLKENFSSETRILLIFDCCHSATLADIDSFNWEDHRICSFSACQDHETSTDTGRGGLLTIAIQKAINELAVMRGDQEYSLQSVFDKLQYHAVRISNDQKVELMHANMDPELTPWPLPRPWWKVR